LARGIEQGFRLDDLLQIPVQMIEILQRRDNRHHRRNVHAIDRHRLANRVQGFGGADQTTDSQAGEAKRFRKRPADDDVRMRG